jgi:2'-5' RNA ligase
VRLFIAIELPEPVRGHLSTLVPALKRGNELSGVSWVKCENWHITLKFLGEVDAERLPEIVESLARIPVEPMQLCAQEIIYFPRRGPIRVFAAGVGGNAEALCRLHGKIEPECAQLGFAPEQREYCPHVTFGRAGRQGRSWLGLRKVRLDPMFPGPIFRADHFVLMRSHLGQAGSKYEVLQRFG